MRFWRTGFLFIVLLTVAVAAAGEKATDDAKEKPAAIAPCKVYVLPFSGELKSDAAAALGKFLAGRGYSVLDPAGLENSLGEDDYALSDLLDRSEGACKIAEKSGAKFVVAIEDNRHEEGRKLLAVLITLSDGSQSETVEAVSLKGKGYGRAVHEICFSLGLVSDAAPGLKLPEKPPDMRDVSRLKKKRIEDDDFEPAGSGVDLVKNGSFEQLDKKGQPVGWETLDRLTEFIVDRPDGGGKCLMFDTDVDQEFVQIWREILAKDPDAKPPKDPNIVRHPPDKPGYNTIGGIEGVLVLSDPIKVENGACYRFTVDVMSDETAAMLFVKGYAFHEKSKRDRQYYLGQKHGDEHVKKEKAARWNTYSHVFFPTWRTPQVEYVRIELYGYWKPGKVYFDNVRFEKVKPLSPELHPEKRADEVSKSYRKDKKDEEENEEPTGDEKEE